MKTSRRFVPRPIPDGDLAAYVSRSISSDAYPHRARVILHAPHDVVRERIRPWAGRLTPLDAHRTLLETGAPSLPVLAMYVTLAGVDFEIERTRRARRSRPHPRRPPRARGRRFGRVELAERVVRDRMGDCDR